jgi:hypothetical protein
MLKARSFSEIFEEITDSTPDETSWSAGWESALEPAGLSQLIGLLEPMKYSRTHIYRYPRAPRFAHALTAEQQQAFENLNTYQIKPLHPGFYASELKSAYRQALLKTHPDQGGTTETFQQVRKSYQILEAFVKNKA